ncbi:MAG: MarR family winged helix-turn-helix transcriptional regulator [Acidobacteriota bacterium]|nr:MarR family winged helix-turn-helix transcriptional regulator [Acidobacteriota bacterium]
MDASMKDLNPPAIDQRIMRLGDKLHQHADHVFRELGLEFHSRWSPVFRLLKEQGPCTLAELAETLGHNHPEILHITRPMSEAGLIEIHKDRLEGNTRMMKLTHKARTMVPLLTRVWERLDEVYVGLFRNAQCEITSVLDRVEGAMNHAGISKRVLSSIEDATTA